MDVTSNNLGSVARELHRNRHAAKPLPYYLAYESFLLRHNVDPRTSLELGVFQGESIRILSKAFPNSEILGVDLSIDFHVLPSLHNVTYVQANQEDSERISRVVNEKFPAGLDLIIDDASHLGKSSKLSFDTLFKFLVPGGVYFIEDWGTGYIEEWPDGERWNEAQIVDSPLKNKVQIISHSYGMVGFVKSLIDYTHESAMKVKADEEGSRKSRISNMEIAEGVVMLLKSK